MEKTKEYKEEWLPWALECLEKSEDNYNPYGYIDEILDDSSNEEPLLIGNFEWEYEKNS